MRFDRMENEYIISHRRISQEGAKILKIYEEENISFSDDTTYVKAIQKQVNKIISLSPNENEEIRMGYTGMDGGNFTVNKKMVQGYLGSWTLRNVENYTLLELECIKLLDMVNYSYVSNGFCPMLKLGNLLNELYNTTKITSIKFNCYKDEGNTIIVINNK